MNTYKVIVAHPGKQHSFRLATALKRKGILLSYITTVYDKNGLIMRIVKKVISEDNVKRASNRHCQELADEDVVQYCEAASLLTLLFLRVKRFKKLYFRWNRIVSARFGKKVAKYAIKKKADMVIMYDSNAAECFEYLYAHSPNIKRVIDVSHSNRLYEKKVFENDMKIIPEWASSFRTEKSFLWETDLNFIRKENELANYFLVPSNYVKKTLVEFGAKDDQVVVTPYGVDTEKFTYQSSPSPHNSEVFFLYVGNATEMKGFGHLLEALMKVNNFYPETTLHFVGGTLDENINRKYGNHVISHGYLQPEEMAEIYKKADVMVFPSLSEGMTLSGLEALCSGVPVICTTNSGINDLIRDEENGFVVEVSNADQIAEKMIWFIEHQDKIPEMKKRAHDTGSEYSWEKYYTDIASKVYSLLEG